MMTILYSFMIICLLAWGRTSKGNCEFTIHLAFMLYLSYLPYSNHRKKIYNKQGKPSKKLDVITHFL